MKKPTNVKEYLELFPTNIQERLELIRKTIKSVAPKSFENLKYGVPAYSYNKILVMFAAFKNHIGFYPTPSAINAFKKELSTFKISKGTIQFAHDKPLPLTLIKKITAYRVKESGKVNWKDISRKK